MIDVRVRVRKASFKGWIQDGNEQGETIQNIEMGSGANIFKLSFDDLDEWQKFIEFFNVTEIKDHRGK
ncbi:MAG: hypothetical protein OCD00_03020 [Colwellia sp.]